MTDAAKQTSIQVHIGDSSVIYTLWKTTAPQNYDGFGTLTLYGQDVNGKGERWVLCQMQHAQWQTDRYRSGLYTAEPSDDLSRIDLTEMLYGTLLKAYTEGR
jgi:hypothetical protein